MDEQQKTPPEGDSTTDPGTGKDAGWGSNPRNVNVDQMVAQLQQMIEQVTVAATPALRQVAAKAAELAASAAAHAGPIAHKVADKTDQVGQVVAQRSSQLASDLRQQKASSADEGSSNGHGADGAAPIEPDTGLPTAPMES